MAIRTASLRAAFAAAALATAMIGWSAGAPAFAQESGGAGRAQADHIVVIGGSLAEIVDALGQSDRLVARDSTSTYPPSITDLPDIGYIRALSPEGVLSVGPDMILTLEGAGPVEAVEALRQAGVRFEQIPDGADRRAVHDKIVATAEALGVPGEGEALASEVDARFDALGAAAPDAAAGEDAPRVLFVLSMANGSVMSAGAETQAQGMIALAGARNALDDFSGYKQVGNEAIISAAPDVILMMDRGGDHGGTDAQIRSHPALGQTPAARNGAIVRMDGLKLLGFGPRTPEAVGELRAAFAASAGSEASADDHSGHAAALQ